MGFMTGVDRVSFPSPRVAFLLVVAGATLRFATLGHQSFWLDETFCVWAATNHTAHAIWTTRLDPNEPSLYFLMLHWFLSLAGVSEATARLPSAIGSVAGLVLVYWLGRSIFPHTAIGRSAAVLLALAPIDVWYAQEARMHGMVATAGLTLALGLFLETWWATLLIVGGLTSGLYLDYTMWPLAILLLSGWTVHWFHRGRGIRSLLRVVAGTTAAWFLCRPVWPQAVEVYDRLNGISFFKNARDLVGLQSLTLVPFPAALMVFAFVCLVVAGLLWAASHRSRLRRWIEYAASFGFVVATVFVAVPRVYGLKQILVGAWPFFILLATWAMVSMDQHPTRAVARHGAAGGAVIVAVAVSLCALSFTFFTPRADWRGVAAHLASQASPRSVVVLDPPWNDLPYGYYRPGRPFVKGPVASRDLFATAMPAINEVCLIAERFGPRPPTSPSEAWLDRNFELVSRTPFSRLELRCYRVPAVK